MKNLLPLIIIIAISFTACKETDSQINAVTNEKMRVELKAQYPTLEVAYIGIAVKDFKDVTITLGDKELFAETDAKKEAIVKNIANMTYTMYEANNYLDKGKIIFTPIEDRLHNSEDPVKEYDMHLDELVKANKD
ncbi:MAG: hypothetical protein JNK00_09100 [Flavipsychrobacter sp.]|nr:hypothetical protein [Flavipsychrobacter sp.]